MAYARGEFAIPVDGAPSTHILKPDNDRLYGSVQNEALCMILARRAGLSVAEVSTGVAGTRSYLLVKRYDRVRRAGRLVPAAPRGLLPGTRQASGLQVRAEPDGHQRAVAAGLLRPGAEPHGTR